MCVFFAQFSRVFLCFPQVVVQTIALFSDSVRLTFEGLPNVGIFFEVSKLKKCTPTAALAVSSPWQQRPCSETVLFSASSSFKNQDQIERSNRDFPLFFKRMGWRHLPFKKHYCSSFRELNTSMDVF